MSLLFGIARCANAKECVSAPFLKHPCARIVASQGTGGWADLQLPEPWSGDLEGAPLLFLGSNPSFAPTEEYPLGAWRDDMIEDFFIHRFDGRMKPWVRADRYTLLKNGEHCRNGVRYWAVVRGYARRFLGTDVVRGRDYVLSEVVHCKSKHEQGVAEAEEECRRRHLRRLLEASGARLVMVLGASARRSVLAEFEDVRAVTTWTEHGGTSRSYPWVPRSGGLSSCHTQVRAGSTDWKDVWGARTQRGCSIG